MDARHELLYDTEAALRLVDGEVRAMTGETLGADVASPGSTPPVVIERAVEELQALLGHLRVNRKALQALASGALHAEDAAAGSLADALRVLENVEDCVLSTSELLAR